jgi:uncharacterized protein (TIGR03086 family)
MTEIADRYRRLSQAFADKVAGVSDDQWDTPTPCDAWKVRDLVLHVARTPSMFFGLVEKDAPELPEEPAAAFDAARGAMQAALDDPEVATIEFDGFFGHTSFEKAVDRFVHFDLLVHGWDLASATGQDTTIEDDDLAWLEEKAQQFGDAARAPGVFGPEIKAPGGADRQTKLLAFVGRDATS